jgi:hypothetical protein
MVLFDDIEHNLDCQELRDLFKWKAVPYCSASFLHYPDSSLNFGYVLIVTLQVYQWSTWHRLDQRLERREFAIRVHRRGVKSLLEIISVHLLECIEYLRDSSVHEMIDSRETDLATNCQEKCNIVHKEDIGCQKNLFVELQQLHRYCNIPGR